eukprot:3987631-Pyramimonas_sp.AAC.1
MAGLVAISPGSARGAEAPPGSNVKHAMRCAPAPWSLQLVPEMSDPKGKPYPRPDLPGPRRRGKLPRWL